MKAGRVPFGSPAAWSNGGTNSQARPRKGGRWCNDCLSSPLERSTTTRRVSQARLTHIAGHLGDRDWLVLATLATARLACSQQIERLHFTGGTPLSNARQARKTLAKLNRLDLVTRLDRRVGGIRSGSAGYVYALGLVGQHLVGRGGPAGGKQVRRAWTPSVPFLDHRLAITELYVELTEAARAGRLELVTFEAEPDSWRWFTGPQGAPASVKPDAYAVTAQGDYEDRWFLEIDRATEAATVIARKAVAYRGYRASGREQARSKVFPLVLFVVPNERRRQVLVDTLARQPAEDWPLFRVVVDSQAVEAIAGGAS